MDVVTEDRGIETLGGEERVSSIWVKSSRREEGVESEHRQVGNHVLGTLD